VRYGIGFLCSTYPPDWNSLDDIAEYSKPNSKFLKAFQGMSKTSNIRTRRKTRSCCNSQVAGTLAKALKADEQGELVVTFQGHGAHGSFFASDAGELTTAEMLAWPSRRRIPRQHHVCDGRLLLRRCRARVPGSCRRFR